MLIFFLANTECFSTDPQNRKESLSSFLPDHFSAWPMKRSTEELPGVIETHLVWRQRLDLSDFRSIGRLECDATPMHVEVMISVEAGGSERIVGAYILQYKQATGPYVPPCKSRWVDAGWPEILSSPWAGRATLGPLLELISFDSPLGYFGYRLYLVWESWGRKVYLAKPEL